MSPDAAALEIVVNGRARAAERGATVASFLAGHGLDPDHVVVERNGEIVGRRAYADTPLDSGDRLEIVHFVGGG